MISFLVDQNFNEHTVDRMTRRDPTLEFTHVRDIGFAEAPDPVVLERAATNGLVLLTHDRKTIPPLRLRPGRRWLAHARRFSCPRGHAGRSGH